MLLTRPPTVLSPADLSALNSSRALWSLPQSTNVSYSWRWGLAVDMLISAAVGMGGS